jgi:hypothetical protein
MKRSVAPGGRYSRGVKWTNDVRSAMKATARLSKPPAGESESLLGAA